MIPPPIKDPIVIQRMAPPPPPSEVALHRALSVRDVPYVEGGADPSVGFDCSGLTQWAYGQSGTAIPRMSWQQWEASTTVENPVPGDLVFFSVYGYIDHAGINIDGKTFIHATDWGKPIEIASLEDPYWAARLVGFGHVGD